MVNFLRYCCINLTVICCAFWVFWPSEAKTITQAAGSRVTLNCSNESIQTSGVIWRMNGTNLLSLRITVNNKSTFSYNESIRLNLKMSESEDQLFALIIESAQKSHEGNYNCETTSTSGVFEEKWELIITDGNKGTDNLKFAVIAAVPSACFLILVSVLAILTIRKCRAKNRSPTQIRQQKRVEDIYENHLEIQRRQAHMNKP